MIVAEILGGLVLVWTILCVDCYAISHRRLNRKPKPVNQDEEHDLLYGSPRVWAERAIEHFTGKGREVYAKDDE